VITSVDSLQADQFRMADLCDRCGSPAQARVEVATGDLQFCLPHFREHHEALAPVLVSPPIFAF
jgi:hypothetical protein